MCLSGENKGHRHPFIVVCRQLSSCIIFFPISSKNKEDAVVLCVGWGFFHGVNVKLVKRALSGNRKPHIVSQKRKILELNFLLISVTS